MNGDRLRAALQAEYLHLQSAIEGFDGRILIRRVAVTARIES
jgi:hypothetical protein